MARPRPAAQQTETAPKPWPADRVERRPLATLAPYARNPRAHSPEQIRQLAQAITEWGWTMPILVDEVGEIIAGHARLEAAKTLGLTEVPVMVASGWSDAQKRAYVIADNQLALNSSWDEELLKGEIVDLRNAGVDLASLGMADADISRMLATQPPRGTPQDGPRDAEDEADRAPGGPRPSVARPGDLWLLGNHRLLCGDSTDPGAVDRVLGGAKASLLFTSPPYGNQRAYKSGGISDWDLLMQGVFGQAGQALAPGGQVLVNLGLIHREGEWHPYWQGWIEWMREQGWKRFGFYMWDQGPALPGDWNGRLGPAFEMIFHFNREVRPPNKWVPCTWAGHIAPSKGGLRSHDGTVGAWQHAGQGVQETRIPDNVLRITRHKARGIETEHPAVFPVLLPEFVMHSYTSTNDWCFEPFSGAGSSIIAGQRAARRVAAIELAPVYVDLTIARWRDLFPGEPVRLDGDERPFDAIAAARSKEATDAQ